MMNTARRKSVIVAYLASMVLLHAIFFWQARDRIIERYPDFTAFYAAGLMVRTGLGHQLYDVEAQTRIERDLVGRPAEVAPLPFLRPAYESLVFLPFSFLPYLWAFIAWNALSLALLWIWIRVMRRQLAGLGIFPPVFWWIALLGFFPVFLNFPMGQDSIILLLLVTCCFLAVKKGASLAAGVWLGAAAFKPQIAVPLFLILFFRPKRMKLLVGFLAAVSAATVISGWVSGWQNVMHYPQYLWEMNQRLGFGTIAPSDMPNLRGLASFFGTGEFASIAVGATSLGLIVAAGIMWSRTDVEVAFSGSIAVALLVGYHTHVYDLALLALPIGLRLNHLVTKTTLRSNAAELAVISLLFFTPLYLLLLQSDLVNLVSVALLILVGSVWISGGSKALDRISPSMGM